MPERLLHGLQNLATAWMEQETLEALQIQIAAREKRIERRPQLATQQRGQLGAQHHTKPVLLHIPAHDALGAMPEMLARGADPGQPATGDTGVTRIGGAQHGARRTIPKQGRAHEHGHARIVGSRAQAAQVDRQEEHIGPGRCLGKARGARQTGNAGAAAETEHRQPFDGVAKPQPVHQHGIEARDGEPGDRIHDQTIDVAQRQAGARHGIRGNALEQRQGVMLKRPGAILPAVGLLIPFERLARIPCLDAGVGIETFHAHQMGKHGLGPLQGLVLIDFVRRIGGCDG